MAITLVKLGPRRALPKSDLDHSALGDSGINDLNYLVEPRRPNRSRWWRSGWIAAIALIWIAIAVMGGIWWMNQSRSASEPLDPKYQRMYVTVVAQRYWQTSDLARAQRDLVQWREQDLAQLLAAMQTETKDPEARKHLAVLAAGLRLPQSQAPPLYSLFSRETIFFALVFALVPLFVAIGIVVLPYVRAWNRKRHPEELPIEEEDTEKLEELLPNLPVEEETVSPAEEKKQEEQKAEEAAAKEEEEQSGEMGDLASLFEEEDTSLSTLEAFTKGMAEIEIEELIKNCKDSVHQLRGLNSASAKQAEPR